VRTLSLILFLIGVPALLGSLGVAFSEPFYIAPQLRRLDPTVTHYALSGLGLAYALSALASAYGALRRRAWVQSTYKYLGITVVAFLLFFFYIAPVPMDLFTFIVGPIFLLLVAFVYWRGWRVIRADATSPPGSAP